MHKGKLISFEGLDGAGKTTQIELLEKWLISQQIEYVRTREPGGTALGTAIRQLILEPPGPMSPLAEAFLFAADRAQHFTEVVIPALNASQVVICDRCFDSSIAYQGYVRGVGTGFVEHLSRACMQLREPHLTILLDLPPEQVALRKNTEDASRFDTESLAFHSKLRAAFLARAKSSPRRMKVVDATQSVEAVHHEVVRLVEAIFEE